MFRWLLRLLGLGAENPAAPESTAPAGLVADPPAADPPPAPPAAVPAIVIDFDDAVQIPPWQRTLAVRTLESTVLRRHALEALAQLDPAPESAADRAFVERLRRLIEADQLDLPPFPDVARELDELLRETTTDILQIARVVERDPGLVRRVWTQARSALYASAPRSLHHAVARVGLDALWRIGMSVCLNDTVLRVEGFQHEAGRIRTLGIVTAEVAALLGNEKRGSLYMAGLLHDVGRLMVLRAAGESRGGGVAQGGLIGAAQDQLTAVLGVLVADSWGMDEAVAAGVGYAADPASAPPAHQRLARTVRAATIAAHATELSRAGANLGTVDPTAEISELGFDPLRALDRASEVMDTLHRAAAPEAANG